MTTPQVKTLVYFDLEATGLKSSGKPRITEICLLAVNSSDILGLHKTIDKLKESGDILKSLKMERLLIPRVVNKMVACVYPMAPIFPVVSGITGLDNDNLSDQSKFDQNLASSLVMFLARLSGPVCLVAHNGDKYDFPLLMAEMSKVGVELGEEILCCDSYIGLRSLLGEKEVNNRNNRIIEEEQRVVNELIEAGEFDIDMLEEVDHSLVENEEMNSIGLLDSPVRNSSLLMTPPSSAKRKSSPTTPVQLPEYKRYRIKDDITPSNKNKTRKIISNAGGKVRKRLQFSPTQPTSYSLSNLHKDLLGHVPLISHGAESDCLALLRTTATLGQDWLDWVDNNSTYFKHVQKMWISKQD